MDKAGNKKETEAVPSGTACIHCGEPCGDGSLVEDGKPFCCTGCQTVYGLLNRHGLSTYYSLEDKPGLKPEQWKQTGRFAYLDKDDVRARLLDFDDGKTARMTFSIPQIHCSSCIWLLENLYRLQEGVHSSRVDFQRRLASVTFDISRLPLSQLTAMLAAIGYEPEINLADLSRKSQKHAYRPLYARLAVAGFAFGNVMLLSFPRYLGLEGAEQFTASRWFDAIKILLSLPVIFYSASVFFDSAWHGLKQRQINMDVPISLGIAILFVRSLHEIILVDGAGYMDSLCALVFLLLIGQLYQKKTYFSLAFDRDYRSYLPIAVMKKSSDGQVSTPLDDVKTGDRLLIRNRELVPADSILISGEGRIDYSFVTGESDPVKVFSGDRLFAGGRQTGAILEIEVVKEPSRSYLLQLWEQAELAVKRQAGLTTLANRVSRYFTPAVLALALAAAGIWWFLDPSRIWDAATAVLIVACPCALALASPFALGTAQRLLGRARFFLRDSSVVEDLAGLTSIVFDKTGTITQSGATEPVFEGEQLSEEQVSWIAALARQSTHPLSVRLAQHLGSKGAVEVEEFAEATGQGLAGSFNGHTVRLGSARWVGAEGDESSRASSVYVAADGSVLGRYRFANLFRPGLREVASDLSGRFRISLLSGDTDADRARVQAMMGEDVELKFSQSPYDKLDFVARKIDKGERVAMVGDGLNDAGALRAAHVGLTVAEDSSGFTPASDGVVNARSFRRLPQVLSLARDTLGVVKVSYAISFLYNAVGLGFAFSGTLSPVVAAILMPASSVTVVLFTTLATSLAARMRGLT
jgi:Cu+-exporting ATPase